MRIQNKIKFIKSIAIFVFILIGLFNISIAKTEPTEAEIITYIVNKGDTLWGIAGEYTPNNKDIRQTIYEIKKLNNMEDSTIYAGQEIQIKKGQ